ncbi:hypothetical protein R3P38DRAFT_3232317 [Favolaschia claudopus]|uniref:Uncharacterized protein n=1 Tax=Favolaschia claudopus TaxID=2862362 RepID=A0AAV9ZJ20_9AGAR
MKSSHPHRYSCALLPDHLRPGGKLESVVSESETTPVAPTVAPAVAPLSLRTQGPWLAGLLFIVVPTQHLQAVPEDPIADGEEHPVWYAITRGRHIGITLSNPFALAAIVGVSGGHMKKYKTQILALQAFNDSLTLGMVAVLP